MGRAAPGPALTAANLEFLKELRMKAKITYLYDEEGQKQSLMAGGDGKAEQEMEVEVPPQDMHLMRITSDGSLLADATGQPRLSGGEDYYRFSNVVSAEDLLAHLRENREKRLQYAAERD